MTASAATTIGPGRGVLDVLPTPTDRRRGGRPAAQLPQRLREPLVGSKERPAERFGIEEFWRRVAERTGGRPRTAPWDAGADLTTLASALSPAESSTGSSANCPPAAPSCSARPTWRPTEGEPCRARGSPGAQNGCAARGGGAPPRPCGARRRGG
ncbi:DUF2267 domain-containing protein, partial [Streptomyces kurssanovii]